MERDALDFLDMRERHREMQAIFAAGMMNSSAEMGPAAVAPLGEGEDEAAIDEETWEFFAGGAGNRNRVAHAEDHADSDPDATCTSDSLLDSHDATSYKRLVQAHQLCRAEREGLQLQVNHLQMQVAALQMQNRRLTASVNELNLDLSEAAERELLQKTKMRDMINFDRIAASRTPSDGASPAPHHSGAPSPHLDARMQSMYEETKAKMREMALEIASLEENLTRREEIHAAQVLSLETNLEGTKKQLVALSDQLAQRTILYENQERRWRSMLTSKSSLFTERSNEFIKLSARFEQLQEHFNRIDAERLEAIVENRDLRSSISSLRAEHADEKERLSVAEQELSSATQRIQDLQIELERIKGADLTELEQTMAAETELIRERAGDRENEILRQAEHLRESLAQVSLEREQFLDEIHQLKLRNRSLEELLRDLRNADVDALHSFELSYIDNRNDDNNTQSMTSIASASVHDHANLVPCNFRDDADDTYRENGPSVDAVPPHIVDRSASDPRVSREGLDESYLTGQSEPSEVMENALETKEDSKEVSSSRLREMEMQLKDMEEESNFLVSNLNILTEQVQDYREALKHADDDLKAAVEIEKMRWENEISELNLGYEAAIKNLNDEWVSKFDNWNIQKQELAERVESLNTSLQSEIEHASEKVLYTERVLDERMADMSRSIEASESKCKDLLSLLETERSKSAELIIARESEIQTLVDENNNLRQQISESERKNSDILKSRDDENERLEREILDMKSQLFAFEKESADLNRVISATLDADGSLEALIGEAEFQNKSRLFEVLINEVKKLGSQQKILEEAQEIDASKFHESIEKLESEKSEALRQVALQGMASIKIESLEAAVHEMELALESTENENSKLKSDVAELKEAVDNLTESLSAVGSEKATLLSSISYLHAEIKEYHSIAKIDEEVSLDDSTESLLKSIRLVARNLANKCVELTGARQESEKIVELIKRNEACELELSEAKRDMLLLSLELDSRTKEYDSRIKDLHEKLIDADSLLSSSDLRNSELEEKLLKSTQLNDRELRAKVQELESRLRNESMAYHGLETRTNRDQEGFPGDEAIANLRIELLSKQSIIDKLTQDILQKEELAKVNSSYNANKLNEMLQNRIFELEYERSVLIEQTNAFTLEKTTLKNAHQRALDEVSILEVQLKDIQHRYADCERRLSQANATIRAHEEAAENALVERRSQASQSLSLHSNLLETQTKLASLEAEKKALSLEHSKSQNQLVALQSLNDKLKAEVEQLESTLRTTKINRDEMFDKLCVCENQLDMLRKQNSEAEKSVRSLSDSNSAMERKMSDQFSGKLLQLESTLKTSLSEKQDLEDKLRILQRQVANELSDRQLREAAQSKLKETCATLEMDISKFREERRTLLAERTELQLYRDDLAQRLELSEREISRLQTRLVSAENRAVASVHESSEELARALKQAEEKISKHVEENVTLQSKVSFFEGNIKTLRRSLRDKYKARYEELKTKFLSEREELLLMVRRECDDIVAQAHQLVIRSKKENASPETHRSYEGTPNKAEGEAVVSSSLRTSRSINASREGPMRRSLTVHPEMLSPEETQNLVRSVLERVAASTWDEFRSSYQFSNRDTAVLSSIDASLHGM